VPDVPWPSFLPVMTMTVHELLLLLLPLLLPFLLLLLLPTLPPTATP